MHLIRRGLIRQSVVEHPSAIVGILLLWFSCVVILHISGPAAAAAGCVEAKRPNFLVILADDLGFSDLGCYGSEISTPNLDHLASNGLRFTQFYNTARCWPSRAALMTGHYAQAVRRDAVPGVPSGTRGTRPGWAKLIPEFLRLEGYRSYHSGKWHIDGKPLDNGFDRSLEVRWGENNYFKPLNTTEDGAAVLAGTNYYSTTHFADYATRCLDEHARTFPDRPFFLYLAFTAPHFPLQAPESDIAKYRNQYTNGWDIVSGERRRRIAKLGIATNTPPEMEREIGPPYNFPKAIERLGSGETNRPVPWTELTQEQRHFQVAKMAVHAAMVDRMDREIGRVLDQLKAIGAFENTVILFASDNGASAEIMVRGDGHDPEALPGSAATFLCLGPGWSSAANTPLRRHKTWVHEGGISTPLIVHWPAGLKAKGELRHAPAHFIDILPTILELAGASRITPADAPRFPGRSLVPCFWEDIPGIHDDLWWQHENNCAIRQGDWKLVKDAKSSWALYNIAVDRGETRDLSSEHPDKAKALATLWDWHAEEYRRLANKDLPDLPRVPKRKNKAQP